MSSPGSNGMRRTLAELAEGDRFIFADSAPSSVYEARGNNWFSAGPYTGGPFIGDGSAAVVVLERSAGEITAEAPSTAGELRGGLTITDHERSEWQRCAADLYRRGYNAPAHRLSVAAALPAGARFTCRQFDSCAGVYRAWLVFGADAAVARFSAGPAVRS